MNRTRLSCLLIVAALVFSISAAFAKDEPIEIVFSTYMPTSYPYLVQPLEDFMAYVEKETGGAVKFKFFHSGQLYKGKEEFAALERGDIDMAAPNDLYLTGIIPNTGISNLPFLWETPASMQKSLDAGLWDLGINQKWGVSGSTASKAIELMEGSPTTMSSGELYMALQRGTINGCTRPLITGLGRKLYEVVDNLSVTNMAYFTCVLAINKEKWDSLPADVQEVMIEAGKLRDQQQLAMLEEFMADAVAQYKEKGVNVHIATPEELGVFKEAMIPVHEWWLGKVPDGKKYLDFIEENH
jgi:TRAP-type C4-dicarboxylate transport system substrate-binding protein